MLDAAACRFSREYSDYRASCGTDPALVASLGACAWIVRRKNLVLTVIDGHQQFPVGLCFRQAGLSLRLFRLFHDGNAA